MVHKKFLFGLAAMALVFGLVLVGCPVESDEEESGGGGGGGDLTLSDFVGTYGSVGYGSFSVDGINYTEMLTVTADSLICSTVTIPNVTTSPGGADRGEGKWIYLIADEKKIGIARDYVFFDVYSQSSKNAKMIVLGAAKVTDEASNYKDKPAGIDASPAIRGSGNKQ